MTADVQLRAYGGRSWGPDTPQWQLYGWGPAAWWLPPGRLETPVYVAIWVADDPDDGDANPAVDANGLLLLHARAIGGRGGRRMVEVLVQRPASAGLPPPRGLHILSWQETRW